MPDIFISPNDKQSVHSHKKEQQVKQKHGSHTSETKPKQTTKHSGLIDISNNTDVHTLPGHSHSPLTSYSFYPDHIKFINEDAGEKIVLFLRKHPITNLPWLMGSFVMIIIPFFASVFSFVTSLPEGLQFVIAMCWYLFTSAFMLEKFLGWFFNADLITDERILDIHFVSLMYREITEAHLDQIQEVTFTPAAGVMTFFDYGDVFIQTAAEVPRIEFKSVPHPQKVAKILRELGLQEEQEKLEGRIR